MPKELVLQIGAPGLGDHLFFSPLPRILKEQNVYDRIYISNFSNFSRNNGIYRKIIWQANPYIDGIIDESGVLPPPIDSIKQNNKFNIIDNYLFFFGGSVLNNNTPEIYYKFEEDKNLINKTIFDSNCISDWVADKLNKNNIKDYFLQNNIVIDLQLPVKYNGVELENIPMLDYKNDFLNWCICIFSCKNLYSMFSGSSNLRAAFKKNANVLLSEPLRHDVTVFKLPNNNYINI